MTALSKTSAVAKAAFSIPEPWFSSCAGCTTQRRAGRRIRQTKIDLNGRLGGIQGIQLLEFVDATEAVRMAARVGNWTCDDL